MDMRGHRSSAWSVTCNLKTVSRSTVDACIDAAKANGWGVEGQLEQGEEGTQHYQLMVKTPQVRFAAVKRVFPTAHIEPARNVSALKTYVHKVDTRVETLKSVEVSFLTWSQVRDKFFQWVVETKDVLSSGFLDEDRLRVWDEFIGLSIEEGMNVDLIGVNPQHRSCILRYWESYVRRQLDKRQTELSVDKRQTDSQEVSLPTIV